MLFVRSFIFVAILICTISGCDDEDGGLSINSMQATVNGGFFMVDDASAIIIDASNTDLLRIEGTHRPDGGPTDRIVLGLLVLNDRDIDPLEYQQTGNCTGANADRSVCIVASYSILENGNQVDFESEYVNFPGTITIDVTSIDFRRGGNVAGTFYGTLFSSNGEEVEISNGEFNTDIEL